MWYDRADGYRDHKARDEYLVRRFFDGLLDDDIRFEVEYHQEPENIDEAVFHVVNHVQTRGRAEYYRQNKRSATRTVEEISNWIHPEPVRGSVTQQVPESNTKQMAEHFLVQVVLEWLGKLEQAQNPKMHEKQKSKTQNKVHIECFKCHDLGHYAKEGKNTRGNSRKEGQGHFRMSTNEGRREKEALNFQGSALMAKGRSK